MEGLKAASVELDRKTLADIAATDSAAFTELVGVAQKALKTKQSAAPQAASKEPKAKTAKAKVVTA
jgi:hypothetical protein